jgi:cyanobactin maturation PatA/PatG family protease
LGLHPKSPFVGVRALCTVMDQAELSLCPSPGKCDAGMRRLDFLNPISQENIGNEYNCKEEGISMKDVHISLDEKTGQAENPSPQPEDSSAVTPSTDGMEDSMCNSGCSDNPTQLVYALGRIDYDFVSRSRRDSIQQKMDEPAQPEEPKDLLGYLDSNPHDASAIQWTLNVEGTPIYVIEPRGPFARDAYELLRQFLREQITEGVERVSIPGFISGMTRLRSGMVIPVVVPDIRGLYSWTTEALVTAVCGSAPKEEGQKNDYDTKRQGVTNFLERVYYEIRNLGREPQERAINFAATNAFEIEKVYEKAIQEEMELDAIEVERSPVCPESADCWDVKLLFFFPQRQVQTVRRVYRFTVDVADVVPATIGPVRSWSIR